ncbi:hypothetical protein L3Q82_013894 [Scortum barcoo]|uniref:Uncharacterized protein n=1 Tax=Scortum barcoo TaxID=214431 RepID=A0ACB8VY83_9TELE|nr:hypothetical protein L3Q82_013894 [Scortum barcoo]
MNTMFEHKGVHQCTWHQDITLGRSPMIDFVVVSSDLRPYVLDTRVKRGAELSTDHHLVVSWIRWQRRKLDRPGRPKRIVRVCWECLAEPSVREVFNSHLRKRTSHRFRGRLGTLSPSGPCSLPPLSTRQFEVVDARSLVPVVAWQSPEPGGGHRKGLASKPQPGRSWRQKLGSGRSSVRPWGGLSVGLEEILANRPAQLSPHKGEAVLCQHCLQCGWGAVDLDWGYWGHCRMVEEILEDLLNPTDLPSNEEAEAGDSEVDSSITRAEVTEVVRKLLGGKAPGVDEIRPEYLKSLDVVGLSWLTRLCNIAWRLGTVPLEWQTGLVVPLFKKGDRRVCSVQLKAKLSILPIVNLRSHPHLWS